MKIFSLKNLCVNHCLAFLCLSSLFLSHAVAEDVPSAPSNQTKAEADLTTVLKPEDGVDFICQCNIFYKIERTITTPSAANSKSPTEQNVATNTEEIHFATIGEQGINGLEVKDRVTGKIPAMKASAIEHCRSVHESNTSCLSGELKRHQSEYSRLDFDARKVLVKSITDDCKNLRAKCVSASESPVTCYYNRPPDQPIPSATDTGKAGGGKGKK